MDGKSPKLMGTIQGRHNYIHIQLLRQDRSSTVANQNLVVEAGMLLSLNLVLEF